MYFSDIKRYLIYVLREIISGNKNYDKLIPSTIVP